MAEFGPTTVDSLVVLAAAAVANNPIRKGEYDADMAGKAASGHTHSQLHDPLTITPGAATITFALVSQGLTAEVKRGTNSGLEVIGDGLAVKWGTGVNDVARGNHTHAQLHDAVTVLDSTSIDFTLTGQQVTAVAIVDGTRGLSINGSGIGVVFGSSGTTVSAGNHSHSNATGSTAGFMSAADKTKLDALPGSSSYISSVANTAGIQLAVSVGGQLTATFQAGEGLTVDVVNGEIDVDSSLFATAAHTHSNATTLASGFMSAADKVSLNALVASGGFSFSIADTQSIDLTWSSGNPLQAAARLKTNGGLSVDENGLFANVGTGATQVAAGNHTHAQLHDAATVLDSTSIDFGVTGQQITGAVIVDASRGLSINGSGVGAVFGTTGTTIAAGNHSHSNATTVTDGFMSAVDKTKLDSLATQAGIVLSVANTGTVTLAVNGAGLLTAGVRIGTGLRQSGVKASGVLTGTANFANGDTITIDGKVYTFQTVLTNVDGNVAIGDSLAISIQNLKVAIEAGTGAGTAYAAATSAHFSVLNNSTTSNSISIKARLGGTEGNAIATTETCANASWANPTLTGGTDTQLDVNMDVIAAATHAHDNATTGSAGFMSAADKLKLDGADTTTNNDTRYLRLAGGQTMAGQFNLAANATTAMQPVTKQQMDGLSTSYISRFPSTVVASGGFELVHIGPTGELPGVDDSVFHLDVTTGGSDGRAGDHTTGTQNGTYDGTLNPCLISRIGIPEVLANKTLSSPTIVNASFSGTITGPLNDPEFTGTVTGAATYSGITLGGITTFGSTPIVTGSVSSDRGDASTKFAIIGNTTGEFNFGYRDGSNEWVTDDNTVVRRNEVITRVLTGYVVGANTAIAATDTILGSFEKVQGQLNNKLGLTGGTLSGHLLFSADNTYDIGGAGVTRPRHIRVAQTGTFGGQVQATGFYATGSLFMTTSPGTQLSAPADGTLEILTVDSNPGTLKTGAINFAAGTSGPATGAFTAPTAFYGSTDATVLGDPNAWVEIKIAGTAYKVPLYS